MKPQTIQLVQDSWKEALPIAPKAAELFYQNLFAADPSLQRLFKGDLVQQGKKLMQMIGAAVGKLHDLDSLVPILQGFGQTPRRSWREGSALRNGRGGTAAHARPGARHGIHARL